LAKNHKHRPKDEKARVRVRRLQKSAMILGGLGHLLRFEY
jgi:hypothetical protein